MLPPRSRGHGPHPASAATLARRPFYLGRGSLELQRGNTGTTGPLGRCLEPPRDPPAFFLLRFHAAACPFSSSIVFLGPDPFHPSRSSPPPPPLHHRLTSPPLRLFSGRSIFLLFPSLSTVADSSTVEVGDIDPFSSHRLSSLPWCRGRLNGYVPSVRPLVALDWIADGLPAGRQDVHLVCCPFRHAHPLPSSIMPVYAICRSCPRVPASPPLCCEVLCRLCESPR